MLVIILGQVFQKQSLGWDLHASGFLRDSSQEKPVMWQGGGGVGGRTGQEGKELTK